MDVRCQDSLFKEPITRSFHVLVVLILKSFAQTVELSSIGDAWTLMWHHCNATTLSPLETLHDLGMAAIGVFMDDNPHTMDMLREKFQWILPLCMKPISFQSKASVVCSVTAAVFIDFCLKKLNVFPNILVKNKWISEFHRTNPQELKCWSIFYVNYCLRYYLMMQHRPIVKRVNGSNEWAHRPYQPLSAPYHCCLYKHRRLDERQPPQTSWPVPICT